MDINFEMREKMTSIEKSEFIENPNIEQIEEYINEFDDDENNKESSLELLFSTFKDNTNCSAVLAKISILNLFYSSGIRNIDLVKMAEHIVDLKIDDDLYKGNLDVVENIANAPNMRRSYSFASKYCSWHNPLKYPIVDSYVKGMLYCINSGKYKFYEKGFTQKDLNDYRKYCEIYDEFIKHFELSDYSYKDIDKYLWTYGKNLLNNNGIDVRI